MNKKSKEQKDPANLILQDPEALEKFMMKFFASTAQPMGFILHSAYAATAYFENNKRAEEKNELTGLIAAAQYRLGLLACEESLPPELQSVLCDR